MLLPLLAQTLLTTSLSFVNTLMCSSIDQNALSAVSYISIFSDMVLTIFTSLACGITVVVARNIGAKDSASAQHASEQAMLFSIVVSLGSVALFLGFTGPLMDLLLGPAADAAFHAYGRTYYICTVLSLPAMAVFSTASGILLGTGDTKSSMVISLFSGLINVAAGAVLILVLKLGVLGAGLAVILARLAGAVLGVIRVAQLPEALRVRRLPRRLDWKVLYPFLHIGIPISLESLLYNGGRFIAQRYTVFMGTAEMAANAVFNSYLTILCVVASACGTLATTAVGMCLGSGRKQEAKSHFFFLMGLSTVSMIVLCGGSALLAKPIVGMYGADPDTALPVFYLMCLMAPISYTFSFAAPYGLKGAGDVRFTSAVSVFSVLFFRVGIGYVLGLGMGLGILGVHAGQYADWTFRAIAFGLRSLGKRWLNFPVHTK